MNGEGRGIERRGLSPRGKRLMEIGLVLIGMLAASPRAEAGDSRSPKNTWAQLMGENVEERGREVGQLDRQCQALERQIAVLQARIDDEESMRYARDPGLRSRESHKLRVLERELGQKKDAMDSLREGAERGAERMAERRAERSEAVEGTRFEFLDPTLDLSPAHLGSESIGKYYERYNIRFSDHRLYMDSKDGQRVMLTVGPEMTDADFYFKDAGKDLTVVFTAVDGAHKTLVLDDGRYSSFFDSNESGRPIMPKIE